MNVTMMVIPFSVLIFFSVNLAFTAKLKPGPRIIGGTEVKNRSQFPYQALLRYKDTPYCGGSIIDEQHILTAAHCCFIKGDTDNYKMSSSDISVVVGNLDLNDKSIVKNVKYVFTHEDYDSSRLVNDIAVLRISGTFKNWTDGVQPIKLTTTEINGGSNCTVSGWGTTSWMVQAMTQRLFYVEVPIVNWNDCNQRYINSLGNKVICAGQRGKDSCNGDSGGPLVCLNNTLTGIVSYGDKYCGTSPYPGVYTEVSKYIDWIEKQKQRSSASSCTISFLLLILLFVVKTNINL